MSGVAQGGSLLVAGFETWPTSPLGTYTIAGENFDLGNPTALTRAIEQVSLDGERISGRRSANRLVKLVVVIRAATRQALDAASGALEMATNQDTWQVQWTPPHLATEAPLPIVYETYRAVTVIDYEVERLDPAYVTDAQFVRAIEIEAPAYPFGKNPQPITSAGTPAITQLMTFESAPSGLQFEWWTGADRTSLPHDSLGGGVLDSTDSTQGTGSWELQAVSAPASYVHLEMTEISVVGHPVDLSGQGAVAIDVKVAGNVASLATWTMAFYDGTSYAYSSIIYLPTDGVWETKFFSVPTSGIDRAHVEKIGFYSTAMLGAGGVTPVAHLDNMRFVPNGAAVTAVTNGGTYQFAGVPGTARANVALVATGRSFGALVVHRAPAEARPDYTPLVPLAPATAPPYTVNLPAYNGATSGQRWNGTHAVWLSAASLNGTGSRTVTVTFTETSIGSVSIARAFTPADVAGYNNMILLGTVNLPYRGQPDGMTDLPVNSGLAWTVTISDTNTADRFNDLLVLDVRGPTVVLSDGFGNTVVAIDEPTPTSGIGNVYVGGATTSLFAVSDKALITGGPFTFEPGDNIVVFYSPAGAPTVSATFSPRWLSTRSV